MLTWRWLAARVVDGRETIACGFLVQAPLLLIPIGSARRNPPIQAKAPAAPE